MLSNHQAIFVDVLIKHPAVRACISSKDEEPFKEILEAAGFVEGVDFHHQWAFHNDEMIIVVDFVFLKEQIVIEIDGKDHKKQKGEDIKRDKLLAANGFEIFRVKSPIPKSRYSFWKYFFKGAILETRKSLSAPSV